MQDNRWIVETAIKLMNSATNLATDTITISNFYPHYRYICAESSSTRDITHPYFEDTAWAPHTSTFAQQRLNHQNGNIIIEK